MKEPGVCMDMNDDPWRSDLADRALRWGAWTVVAAAVIGSLW